ncbi:non-ribosomal peptide synthetase [Piscinibacter terrae]|nr:non-ribosomal peptide synthetase [Albitalea terrae]
MRELAERGVRVGVANGELKVTAARNALTDELKSELRRLKGDILAALQSAPADADAAMPACRLRPEDRLEPFPFSDLQMAFYMADNPYLEYHVRPHYYVETDCDGLDVDRYLWALNKALHRHRGEVVMVVDDGHLAVMPEVPLVQCPINDWRHLDEAEAKHRLAELRSKGSRQQLPLGRWPWFDLQISHWREAGRERTRIHFNHNNFYTDGYGATVLQREVDRLYENPQLELPPLTLTIRDAILALHDLADSPAGERARRYWLDRLPELPGPPELPMTSANKRVRSQLQRREGYLTAEQWDRFKTHAGRCGLTPTGAIACAYAEILSAWSGSQHFILSNMVTRRLPIHPEVMQIVGNFASLYPLEVDLRGGTFAQKALRLQQQMMRDAAHREWGGMQVMQAMNRMSGSMGTVPCPFVIGSGLFMEKYKKADFGCLETAQTVMDHQFWELNDGRYFYVWDLLEEFFPAGMINAMWRAFAALLENLAADGEAWQSTRLDIAPAAEPAILGANYETMDAGLLHHGLDLALRRQPKKAAVRSPQGALSYAALDAWSAGIAAELTRCEVAAGELVAIVMERGPAIVASSVGILRAGAAYVPVDPGLPAERLRYMLENSRARIALTSAEHRARIDWPAGLRVVVVEQAPPASSAARVPAPATAPTDLAYVIYTSGSTGRPKGVMIDHRGARNTVVDINDRFGITRDDVVFGVSSFSFDLSVYDVFGVLEAGATVVYPDPASALNPGHWLDLMDSEGVTVWNSAPPLMGLLVETALRRGQTLPHLRIVMLSGDWIPVELPEQIRQIAPQARIYSLGGATEASIWSIYYEIGQVEAGWTRIPYGKPLAKQAWHVRDAQNRPTPTWTVGDLYISGIGLAQGYWADEEKTQASFITDPLTSQRLYRTGDRGRYLPDGNIEFMGRADTQVKIQGHRIELGEIETVLNACPLVKEAAVLVRSPGGASVAGPGLKELVGCAVLRQPAPRNDEEAAGVIEQLRAALRHQLPAYMVPPVWMLLEQMPLSSNGKLDRIALGRQAAGARRSEAGRAERLAPRTPTEVTLAELWKRVLRLDSVGIRDDFFESGGQSIDAVRYVALVQESLGRLLSLGDVWEHRTIESQAAMLDLPEDEAVRGNLMRLGRTGQGRPYFMVHPAGGQSVGYYELAGLLERPSYGFVAHAEEAAGAELSSIEAIAHRYVTQLKQEQPRGPYSLVGWSSGGCIAFAMAHELERGGDVVDQLTLIDCPAPVVHDPIGDEMMLHGFIEDLNLGVSLAGLQDGIDASLPLARRFEQVVARLTARGSIALDAGPLLAIYRVFHAVVTAVRAYWPGRVAANLLVLRASQGEVSEFAGHPHTARADWGWSLLTTGQVHTRRITGSHYTVLGKPGVVQIADVLQAPVGITPTHAAQAPLEI